MNVDLMRRIDYFAGVPLCLAVSLAFRLRSALLGKSRVETQDKPKNILFLELSEMGSTVLADPAMKKAQGAFGAELHFVIFAKNRPGLSLSGTVPGENIFAIRDGAFLALAVDAVRFLVWTRRKKIDTVFDLELFSRFSALLTALSGASNRIGFHAHHNEGLYRGGMLTHRVAYNPHIHIAKNFIAQVNALVNALAGDAAATPEDPYSRTLITDEDVAVTRIEAGEGEKKAVLEKIQAACPSFDPGGNRILLVNPNASQMLPQRRWPADRYVELIRRLLADAEDIVVLITGAPEERHEAGGLVKAVGSPRCVNFAGGVEFLQLTALYSLSALMVTNDSGPGHFASLTEMPVVVLFGPETPHLYKPLGRATALYAGLACSPCVSAANHRKTTCRDNRCMAAITVDQVFEAALNEL